MGGYYGAVGTQIRSNGKQMNQAACRRFIRILPAVKLTLLGQLFAISLLALKTYLSVVMLSQFTFSSTGFLFDSGHCLGDPMALARCYFFFILSFGLLEKLSQKYGAGQRELLIIVMSSIMAGIVGQVIRSIRL